MTDIIFEDWNSLKIFKLSDLKGIRLIQVPKPVKYRKGQLKKKDRGMKSENLMLRFRRVFKLIKNWLMGPSSVETSLKWTKTKSTSCSRLWKFSNERIK